MRAVTSVLIFLSLATPAFADLIPEPGTVSLVAVGVAAALWFGRGKKK